jgi:hypothetical protein
VSSVVHRAKRSPRLLPNVLGRPMSTYFSTLECPVESGYGSFLHTNNRQNAM